MPLLYQRLHLDGSADDFSPPVSCLANFWYYDSLPVRMKFPGWNHDLPMFYDSVSYHQVLEGSQEPWQ